MCGSKFKSIPKLSPFLPLPLLLFQWFHSVQSSEKGKFIRKLRPVEYCIAFTKLYHAFDYCHLHRKITDHASLLRWFFFCSEHEGCFYRKKERKNVHRYTNSALRGIKNDPCYTSFGNLWCFCSLATVLYCLNNAKKPESRVIQIQFQKFYCCLWRQLRIGLRWFFFSPQKSASIIPWISVYSPGELLYAEIQLSHSIRVKKEVVEYRYCH